MVAAMFALGLAKTAAEGTTWMLRLVKSAVEEERELRKKVQSDLVFISDEFEMMQSFLRAVNKERVGNAAPADEVVLTWVRQVRTLAFDIEDCVEIVIHLDLNKPSCSCYCWGCGCGWLRRAWQKVYYCASPRPLDEAVAEIKHLKARVEDVSQRNTRYKLIRDSNNNNNNSKTMISSAVIPPTKGPAAAGANSYPSSSAFNVLLGVWEANGKLRRDIGNLKELIARADDNLQVVSVWGGRSSTGGDLGTAASIITKAYCDPEVCETFRSRAWVKLTHPFNHHEFVKSLLTQFCATSTSQQSHQANADAGSSTEDNLMRADKDMMQQMRDQRYLLVLEDVLTVAEWDVIRMYLPDDKKGSRIIVSTTQLGMALLCTGRGKPYQVSELRHFSDGQFLCAIFEKMQSSLDSFKCQLRRRPGVNVISVWGASIGYPLHGKSEVVDILYKGIINRLKEFDGISFARHTWVDVPEPFNLTVFARRLFLNFYSDDIRASEIREVGDKDVDGIIERCKFLIEKDGLVVINGLQSSNDWNLIKSRFLLSSKTRTKGCIIVVTDKKNMAEYCVQDHGYQAAFNVKDLVSDPAIATLLNKGTWYCGLGGKKGRLFYDTSKDSREWARKFKIYDSYYTSGKSFGLLTVTASKIEDVRFKAFLRNVYYGNRNYAPRRSWVDMNNFRFNLDDICWRLLLDFHSHDIRHQEAVAVSLMEGTLDHPIEECRKLLSKKEYLVVINGLDSTVHWDLIRDKLLSEHIQGTIIVSATNNSLATHCKPERMIEAKDVPYADRIMKEYSGIFCEPKRWEKATEGSSDKFQLVGRSMEKGDLARLVARGCSVVSVWGIAGVGKSSLVMNNYYFNIRIEDGPALFLSYGRVDVPDPFNLTQFCCCLLVDFYSDNPQAKEAVAIGLMEGTLDPIQECCKFIHGKEKCLVVIDGLRSTQDWDLIKDTLLPETITGTIVVITTEEKVAMHCVQNIQNQVLNIRRLEADAALDVLVKKVASNDKPLTSEEMEISKSIVAKCGGLPKVISVIGEACSLRLERLRSCPSYEYCMWPPGGNFIRDLETEPEFHGLRPLFFWMQSYFDACSDSIKPCIFYLSIFSAEKNIRRRRLLWRWITEGYCRDTSDGRACEENGENYISELVNLSIIQQSPSSNKVLCQINGFFHEYIISRPMEDNLVFALEKGCSLNSARAGQHLTIRSSWDRRDRIVYESIDFSRLRSLTVFGEWKLFFISSENVNMKLLRVLDLEDATHVTNEDLEQIGKRLHRLKFLSLRGCAAITCLPSSMGALKQLETLDVRHTCVVTLAPVITKLKKLQYIRAGTTTEVWDWEGNILTLVNGEDDNNRESSSSAQVRSLPAMVATPTPTQEGWDSTSSSSAQVTNLTTVATTDGSDTNSTSPVVLPSSDIGLSVSRNNRPCTWASSLNLLSKLRKHDGVDNDSFMVPGAGVMVSADIGKLTVLHTLGVVKVNAPCSKGISIFKEMKKLTQLRKLSVCGINKGNIHEFCSAITDHAYLKSLSVELDKDDGLDDRPYIKKEDNIDIPQLPNTIKSLKLHGRVHKLLVRMKHLNNLEKLHLTLEDLKELRGSPELSAKLVIHHLRIRLIQDGDLHIGPRCFFAQVLEIQCSSELHIMFHDDMWHHGKIVEVLKVHFSRSRGSSSLTISGLSALKNLREVWLKGYTDQNKQYMKQQINGMVNKPVLKLVQTR